MKKSISGTFCSLVLLSSGMFSGCHSKAVVVETASNNLTQTTDTGSGGNTGSEGPPVDLSEPANPPVVDTDPVVLYPVDPIYRDGHVLYPPIHTPDHEFYDPRPDTTIANPQIFVIHENPDGTISLANSRSTRDIDLQRSTADGQRLNTIAQGIADRFQMAFAPAMQLTQIADRVQQLAGHGQALTAEDRQAVVQSVFAIAGTTSDEVTSAALDASTTEALLTKTAANLGTTRAILRDQLLPALGVQLN